jgi:transcriptional regulator with AAA-type ATPase domain
VGKPRSENKRDAFTILMGKLLQQLPVLQQYLTAQPGDETILIVGDWGTGTDGLIRTVFHWISSVDSSMGQKQRSCRHQ